MEKDLIKLQQEFKDYKEFVDKKIIKLETITQKQEDRIQALESEKKKTDYQFDQIMEMLNKLNDETIPNLTKELQGIKDKPNKRYEQVIASLISAVVGGCITFMAAQIFK